MLLHEWQACNIDASLATAAPLQSPLCADPLTGIMCQSFTAEDHMERGMGVPGSNALRR